MSSPGDASAAGPTPASWIRTPVFVLLADCTLVAQRDSGWSNSSD